MGIQLSTMTVLVNDAVVPIVPNSLKFTEGFGEQNIRAASSGGNSTEQVFSQNVEEALGKVMFDIYATPAAIALQRGWQANLNRNVVQLAGSNDDGDVTRTYTQCALVNDPEVEVGSEGVISLEFKGNKPV